MTVRALSWIGERRCAVPPRQWSSALAGWTVLAALLGAGCGGDGSTTGPSNGGNGGGNGGGGTPFAITAVTPADGASDVETGAVLTAQFNAPVAPATLNAGSFTLTSVIPRVIALSYDATSQTARASAPLVPGATFQVAVTTAVHDASGRALSQARQWSFTTRSWQNTTVDAGANAGQSSSLALDGSGQVHVAYLDATNQALKYATCATSCTQAGSWQTVTVDATATIVNDVALAIDGSGQLHIAYVETVTGSDFPFVRYATCSANCTAAASWQIGTVLSTAAGPAIAVDGSGRLHAAYVGFSSSFVQDLAYATCAASCAQPANWAAVTIDPGSDPDNTSIAVDASGQLHVAYSARADGTLRYATCAASCTAGGNWQTTKADASGTVVRGVSLKLDGAGRRHVAYFDGAAA